MQVAKSGAQRRRSRWEGGVKVVMVMMMMNDVDVGVMVIVFR